MMRATLWMLLAAVIPLTACAKESAPAAAPDAQHGAGVPAFTVRPGYRVTLAAEKIADARFLEFDDKGTLYVTQPKARVILSLRDTDGDGVFETVKPFVRDKYLVHGLCFHDGWLWFSQTSAIGRARDTNGDGVADDVEMIIPEGKLPGGSSHWWRSLLVTDDAIYTSVGDSGNITDEVKSDRQKIWKFDLKGGNRELFVSGIRNTEKLRVRPGTKQIWGCDHGSDNFGAELGEVPPRQPVTDLNPPDEFNLYEQGGFYGHPFLTGNRVPRLEYQKRPDILDLAAKTRPPEWLFGAHWATNGWTFLAQDRFKGHKGDAIIACHGSWNSSKNVGYRIERVMFDPWTGKPYGSQLIVSALSTDGEKPLARPVDCAEAPDGSILFSSDSNDHIYRITPAE